MCSSTHARRKPNLDRRYDQSISPRSDIHGDLPIKLGPVSNGEFIPPPTSPIIAETIRRTNHVAGQLAGRLSMSRRRFLASTCGSALTLLTLQGCADDERASRPPSATSGPIDTTPGGTFDIPAEATVEPEAAAEVLAGDEFIMDVQAHLLDYELTPDGDWDGTPFIGQTFPQRHCGETDPRACFSIDAFLDLFFLQSDTSVVVLSSIPVLVDNPLSNETMAKTQAIARALCADGRVLAQGQATPNVGPVESSLEAMAQLHEAYTIGAWKAYSHLPAPLAYFLDDHDPEGLPVGQAFIDFVREVGPPIVAVHKGFRGVGGAAAGRFASPVDIGPAAARNSDVSFVVYHSGYESDVTEGAYDPAAPNGGTDRLIASVEAAGVGPGQNVYAELGSTWRAVMGAPDTAAHVLGKLLCAFGEDNVVWGTDSIWYGSPQDQIEAFRAFEISEAYQEEFGYPALTGAVKAKILGLNSARLYGIEPVHRSCTFDRAQIRAIREELALPAVSLGPSTTEEASAVIAAHAV